MKQKVLKKLGLLALSSIMVVPNVLGGKILENNSKPIGNEKAYPKLSTKDAGKNPKKESTVKAKSGSGFFGKLFKLVGGVVVLNETHNLIRSLIGNPWFCLGMAEELYMQTPEGGSLTGAALSDYFKSEAILTYFQRTTGESPQQSIETGHHNHDQSQGTKPVFQGILTPMSEADENARREAGKEFAKNHPYLALLILKRFDTMLTMGIDILKELVISSNSSNSSYTMIE